MPNRFCGLSDRGNRSRDAAAWFSLATREHFGGFAQRLLVNDCVSAVDALGLVSGQLHCGDVGNAEPIEIARRRSPQIVGDAMGGNYGAPRFVKMLICDRLAVFVMPQRRDDHSQFDFDRVAPFELRLDCLAKFRRKWKPSAVVVLRFAGIDVEPSVLKIDVRLLAS